MAQVLAPRLEAAIAELRERPISGTEKGFGVPAPGAVVSAASLGARRPSLFGPGFTMPVLVLRESAVAHNVNAMAAYCAAAGVRLAPHGKTTMAPQLFAQQLAAGAWAVTAATVGELHVYRAFGVPRVLLANELTDPAGAAWLAGELATDPGFDCYVYADSLPGGVGQLVGEQHPRNAERPVHVQLPDRRRGDRPRAGGELLSEQLRRHGRFAVRCEPYPRRRAIGRHGGDVVGDGGLPQHQHRHGEAGPEQGRAPRTKAGGAHHGTGSRDAEPFLGPGNRPLPQLRDRRLETGGKRLRHHCVPWVGVGWDVTRK